MIGRVLEARKTLERTQAGIDRRQLNRELRKARARKAAAAVEYRRTPRWRFIRRRELAAIYVVQAEIIEILRSALCE